MQCPYYKGIRQERSRKYMVCADAGQTFLFEYCGGTQRKIDTCCIGKTERNNCRPYLYGQCKEMGIIETPFHGSTDELRRLYLEKISESGTKPRKEEQQMDESLKKTETEISTRRQYAEKLHNKIMYNAQMVCDYLVELCKDLKRMRDEKYYTELGYDTFDDYVENDVGIKKRQAYTYISTYERLGDTVLQSNAKLGITKLAILANAPAPDRPALFDDPEIGSMSASEIRNMVETLKNQGEQLSLLTDERDKAKTAADNELNACHETARQLKEIQERAAALEKENEKLKSTEPDSAAIEKAKKQAEKEAAKKYADKLKEEKDKAKRVAISEAEERIKAARGEGEKAAAERIKQSLEAVEQEKADALRKSEELEKKLRVSSNQDTALFNFLFDAWQQEFNKMCGLIKKVNKSDSDFANKMRRAVKAVLEQHQNIINNQ